jgi:type II secretory pathway predicted ATPase ExeA
MYERHWRLKRAPFGHDGSIESFFASSSHHTAVLKLRYLIDHRRGLGLLVGASGSGKTRLLEAVLQPARSAGFPVVTVVYPQMSPIELLNYIARKLSGEKTASPTDSMDVVLGRLEELLGTLTSSGRPPIIVIDDAHLISDRPVLQSLQLLLNFQQSDGMDFTLILAGQPEMVGVVKRLPQLDDRVAMPCVLHSLSTEETAGYIRHRLQAAGAAQPIFSETALTAIHELSGGLPRRINRLCDFALLVGYAEELTAIDVEQVEGVHAELNLSRAA